MILSLDARVNSPYEIGAVLDAVLCFPTFTPDKQLKRANAICLDLVDRWIRREPHRRNELEPLRREYRGAAGRTALGSLEKRRNKAMVAGQAFLPLIKSAALAAQSRLLDQHREPSRHQIASYIWPPNEGGYEEDYLSRLKDRKKNDVWPWYPVAHLAAAYQAIVRQSAPESDGTGFDYQDLTFHLRVVTLANVFARYFRESPQLHDIAWKLIDIEIVVAENCPSTQALTCSESATPHARSRQ